MSQPHQHQPHPGAPGPQHTSGQGQPTTPPAGTGPPLQQPQAGQQHGQQPVQQHQTPPAQQHGAPAPQGAQPPAQQGGSGTGWRMEDLPEGARAYIANLRGEAAEGRTGRTAAEQQMANLMQVLQQATGQSAPTSPEQLATQLADEQRRNRQKDVELAVLRIAGQHGGDPVALLDSRGFLDRVHGLDPSTQTFAASVAQEIQHAVQANPRLAAVTEQTPATAPGGRAMGQGRAGTPTGPTGVAAGRALRQERRQRTRGQSTTT